MGQLMEVAEAVKSQWGWTDLQADAGALLVMVTSQKDRGDLGGGAMFSKVRKYFSACLLSTHRFAIWRYPDTGQWWGERTKTSKDE